MKIECVKDKLENAVKQAEKITGKNLTLPVLSCILLQAKDNYLIIKSTNLDLGIEIKLPVKVEKEGVIAAPGTVLSSFVSNLQADKNIKLEVIDGNLYISTLKNKTTIKTLPSEDFPTIPILPKDKIFLINISDFINGLKSVWYSSSISSIKPELGSVFIYFEDENMVFVATDSFRLAEKRMKVKKNKEWNGVLIPFKNISEIIRIFDGQKGEMEISMTKNQISFSFEGIYLTSRVIDGTFPDYKQIIPKEFKTEAVILKQDLLNALRLSNVFSDKFNQVNVKVRKGDKSFEIKTKNADVGENMDKMDAVIEGDDVDMNFNFKYIIDCMQSIPSDSIAISFNGPSKPMVIRGVSDKSFTYLVMPMNR